MIKTILLMALTADGKTARSDSELINWTSKEDKKYFVELTKKAGVLIFGRKTYETIGKPLPQRLNIVITRDPQKYSNIENSLEFTDKKPKEILEYLGEKGFSTAIIAGGPTINTLFLRENLINEIHLTVEPVIFGQGKGLFSEEIEKQLELIESKNLNKDTILLKYKVKL